MRAIVVFIVTSLFLAVLAFPAVAPAGTGPGFLEIHNVSGNEMLVTLHVLLPPFYRDHWAAPGKDVWFHPDPGPLAWHGVLYISVRASTSDKIDENSRHVCLSSLAIKRNSGRSYAAHYNGHDCWISQD